MLTLIRSFSVVLAALTLSVTAEAQTWLQVRKGAYIINYQSGYEQDLPLATRWMDAGEALAGSKFRIPPPTVRLWLEPNPMKWAGVGSASAVPGGNKSTDIYVLTPSGDVPVAVEN